MQADTQLVLGEIAFQRFEIPEKINFGGKHILNRHTLIGGKRVLDAMGPDPDDIHWHGRFRGNEALSRAKACENLWNSGRQVTLSWGGLTYQVVVQHFDPSYERRYEIPYKITCVVSEVQTSAGAGASPGAILGGDITSIAAAIRALP